jgi:peptidyl-lysine (3S)-dioxygenase / protease
MPRESNTPATSALRHVLQIIEDYHDFNPETTVPVYDYPTAVEFGKQVSWGRPCVYRLQRPGPSDVYGNVVKQGEGNGAVFDDAATALRKEQRSILDADCFKWTKKSLCALVKEEVEVAITPDGRADSLYSLPSTKPECQAGTGRSSKQQEPCTPFWHHTDPTEPPRSQEQEEVFVEPANVRMTLLDLIDKLCPPSPNTSPASPVYYLQSQNSNLSTGPLSSLLPSFPSTPPPFALPVLGSPEATNIWVGNHQSVTSTHRDPYENLYLVVKGAKRFVLYAPVEEICLHSTMVRTGRWVYEEGAEEGKKFGIQMDEEVAEIPWIPIDPNNPPVEGSKEYPYYRYARPVTVTVNEEEILYLPSGWFHHVSQECGSWKADDHEGGRMEMAPCIAVNYWFDMDYTGEKYVMREMLSRLVGVVRASEDQARSKQKELKVGLE